MIQPALLLVIAQSLTGDLSFTSIMQYAVSGGTPVMVFLIWYLTFRAQQKKDSKERVITLQKHEEKIKEYKDLVEKIEKKYQDQVDKVERKYQELVKETVSEHKKIVEQFISVIKEQQELNTYSAGIMQRIEVKLDELLRR
jgi:hypothetical protein